MGRGVAYFGFYEDGYGVSSALVSHRYVNCLLPGTVLGNRGNSVILVEQQSEIGVGD